MKTEDDLLGLDHLIDATETITCFENGKTWECPECGSGIGTDLRQQTVQCLSCEAFLADHDSASREPREWDRDEDGNPIGLSDGDGTEADAEVDDEADVEQSSALDW